MYNILIMPIDCCAFMCVEWPASYLSLPSFVNPSCSMHTAFIVQGVPSIHARRSISTSFLIPSMTGSLVRHFSVTIFPRVSARFDECLCLPHDLAKTHATV